MSLPVDSDNIQLDASDVAKIRNAILGPGDWVTLAHGVTDGMRATNILGF
jgi:hypothetical protein